MRLVLALVLVLVLAACAGGRRAGCGPRPLAVVNLAAVAVEQIFLGSGAPDGWEANLLGTAGLPGGASTIVTVPGSGAQAVRAVWSTGQAVELRGIDACRIRRVTVLDAALRAD